MSHRGKVLRSVLAILAIILAPRLALAYIDPGTTQSIFTFLAPVLALLGAFVGYMLWPFRYAIFRFFRKRKPPEDSPQPPTQEPPKQE